MNWAAEGFGYRDLSADEPLKKARDAGLHGCNSNTSNQHVYVILSQEQLAIIYILRT